MQLTVSSRSPRTSLLTREEAEVIATRSRRLMRVGRAWGAMAPLWNWRVTGGHKVTTPGPFLC